MRPLQISPETAIKLSEKLKIPIEELMHMPQHILMKKLADIAERESVGEVVKEKPDENI